MFRTKDFLEKVNAAKIKEALDMLKKPEEKECDQIVIQAIKAIDSKTKDTLLHQLAQSAALNDALEEKAAQRTDALTLLSLVLQHSDTSIQKKSNKRTALVEAAACDHRALVDGIYRKADLAIEDSQENTILHYAIHHANHVLIGKIIEDDDSRFNLYFKQNKAGLFSLALAMKKYQENPSALSLSLINQLYFSLPKGRYRSLAVETDITVDWSIISRPLWKNALRMCGKRDGKDNVKLIDLNLWDLVCQVVKDGLTVYGLYVTLDVVFEYSDSECETPGKMLKEANEKREVGLPGRTLAQTATNATLARNKEFMQRAQLGQAKYHLFHTNADPTESKDLNKLFDHNKDWIILFKDKLFYLPQHLETKPSICKEIEKAGRREKDQAAFDSLKQIISELKLNTDRAAVATDIQYILPLVPLLFDQKNYEMPLMTVRKQDHRVMGMTFCAGLPAASPAKKSEQKSDVVVTSPTKRM